MSSQPDPKRDAPGQAEPSNASGSPLSWDSLALPEGPLSELRSLVESLEMRELLRAQGFNPPPRVLLIAPRVLGNDIVRLLARETGHSLIVADVSDVRAAALNQDEAGGRLAAQKVAELFVRARASAPSILLFGDIEQIAAQYETSLFNDGTTRTITQFLVEMENHREMNREVLLVAATSRPELVSPVIHNHIALHVEIPAPAQPAPQV
jgi:SpoVK/Ycf46/Vps4 family AAA+-type ATPase